MPIAKAELKTLAKKPKQTCGSGESVKNNVIEIQRDHRNTVPALVNKEGYAVKTAGG